MADRAFISVRRPSDDLFGMARKMPVYVDGHQIGRVAHNTRQVFEIEAGVRRITVAMDWCRSEPITLRVEPGQCVELCAFSRYRANLPMNLVGLIFWPRRFFIVQQQAVTDASSDSSTRAAQLHYYDAHPERYTPASPAHHPPAPTNHAKHLSAGEVQQNTLS